MSHDPSEIILIFWDGSQDTLIKHLLLETIIIIINFENSFVAKYICGNRDPSWTENLKVQHYFLKVKTIYKFAKDVTFDECNISNK